jgi:hypothetical protein
VLQSISSGDPTIADQISYEGGPDYVPSVAAFATSQGGSFDLEIDINNAHTFTDARRAAIIAFFDAA